MLVEPEKLLMRAKKDGLTVLRTGSLLNISGPKSKLADWADIIKQYKPALLELLPDEGQAKPGRVVCHGENLDLFGYDMLGNAPAKPAHPRRSKADRASNPMPLPTEGENQPA